jgi:hypothetical protein
VIKSGDYLKYEDLRSIKNKEKELKLSKEMEDRELMSKIASPNNPGYLTDNNNGCRVWDPVPKQGEIVIWSGACKDGFAEGYGTATWQYNENGIIKTQIGTGNYVKGRDGDGKWEVIFEDGRKEYYELINNQKEGRHTVVLHGVIISDVLFVNNKLEGKGLLTYPDGSKFEGLFKNNKKEGYGKLYWPNKQLKYEGEFIEGLFSGDGKLYNIDGKLYYKGNFKNNVPDGYGTSFISEHQYYEGYFKEGQANGRGIYYMKNNDIKTSTSIKAKNDCLWIFNEYKYFHTLSTPEGKCKIDGYPF